VKSSHNARNNKCQNPLAKLVILYTGWAKSRNTIIIFFFTGIVNDGRELKYRTKKVYILYTVYLLLAHLVCAGTFITINSEMKHHKQRFFGYRQTLHKSTFSLVFKYRDDC
jgi:hypothetical protein